MASTLQETYRSEVMAKLTASRGYTNQMQVPRPIKVVLSTGIGSDSDKEMFTDAVKTFGAITGQKPVITKAKKSVANFKLREGMNVGVCVTLRGQRMWDFLYRLMNIALPRVRDFRGVSNKAFDGRGNYSLGLSDQSIFTEINLDQMKYTIGMNITIVTTAQTNEECLEMLTLMGMPFEK